MDDEPVLIERDGRSWTLFDAAHAARPDLVRELIAKGAEVNRRASSENEWGSSASEPTALNCALIAPSYDAQRVATVGVLVQAGASVDETHHLDFKQTAPDGPQSRAIEWLLRELATAS
jgi:hypothetical protein